ncbi:hypothetical protein K503DRAFT_428021 [Rhizopogon vinicolor AM-OR11-026]|uniref:Uncharacterized protein n=1 Tax=Rhizopogon vinicolor AM-OR11-026 TaxID=1314800 RepID=A0A1B7MQ18_9AGAM|nr:hypothetical protein K503DRAFT_428021 [Rhizopogon vinicolor AM-OR11-026]
MPTSEGRIGNEFIGTIFILYCTYYCSQTIPADLMQSSDACQQVPIAANIAFVNLRQPGTTTHICTCAISLIFCPGSSRPVRTIPDNLRQPENRGFSPGFNFQHLPAWISTCFPERVDTT